MRKAINLLARALVAGGLVALLSACNQLSAAMNPLYEAPAENAYLGQANDHALTGEKTKAASARQALDAMATYQRALDPNPTAPVLKPAIVRLMWVPDHLNRNGDLVPAHFYYLKVKSDQFAVSDAFELEGQLNGPRGAAGTNSTSALPYVFTDDKNR